MTTGFSNTEETHVGDDTELLEGPAEGLLIASPYQPESGRTVSKLAGCMM
jgi:hypothetical protein